MRNDRLRSGTGPLPHSYTQLLRKIILGVQLCPLPGSNSERMKFSGPDIPNPLPPEQPPEPPRPSPSPLPGHPPPGPVPEPPLPNPPAPGSDPLPPSTNPPM
jgi:hypothetical protein